MSQTIARPGHGQRELLRSHAIAAHALPAEPTRQQDMAPAVQEIFGRLYDRGVLECVEKIDTRTHHYRIWVTPQHIIDWVAECVEEPRTLPCGHTGIENLNGSAFSCGHDGCDARYDRDQARAYLTGVTAEEGSA